MRDFVRHAAGKVAASAFDLYKHQTIRKYRGEVADEYAKAVRGIAGVSRKALVGLVFVVPFLASGVLLLALGAFAFAYGFASDTNKDMVCMVGGFAAGIFGLLCFIIPVLVIIMCTTETFVRKRVDADKWENKIRGRSR